MDDHIAGDKAVDRLSALYHHYWQIKTAGGRSLFVRCGQIGNGSRLLGGEGNACGCSLLLVVELSGLVYGKHPVVISLRGKRRQVIKGVIAALISQIAIDAGRWHFAGFSPHHDFVGVHVCRDFGFYQYPVTVLRRRCVRCARLRYLLRYDWLEAQVCPCRSVAGCPSAFTVYTAQ